jgi:hypothetical protein
MARVLFFGAGWVALLAALALSFGLPARPQVPAVSTTMREAAISAPPPPPRVGTRFPGWTVTRAYSAHHMMVVEVETDVVGNASRIAAQVVEPLKARYDEVLIYIREPGQRPEDLPARRIQWTPRAGYVESVYSR